MVSWRKMAEPFKSKALYSAVVAFLGFVCFAISAVTVGMPLWGYFENLQGEFGGLHDVPAKFEEMKSKLF